MPYHFGIMVLEGKCGLKLTREKYAFISNHSSFAIRFSADIYTDKEGKIYSIEWCKKQLDDCLKNFDLNMQYFSLLSHDEFNKDLNNFLIKNKQFVEVFDLNLLVEKSGYYIMVLDEYCQLYIGTSADIRNRIRQHWNKCIPFDRLLFPMGNVGSSVLSINSFCALDTSRIFAYITSETFTKEDKYINQFSSQFVCNRLSGGKFTGGLLQAISMMKTRNLI